MTERTAPVSPVARASAGSVFSHARMSTSASVAKRDADAVTNSGDRAVTGGEVSVLSDSAARLATERRHEEAVAALLRAADGDADTLHAARTPFLLRLHSDASDLDATRALIAIERAVRVLEWGRRLSHTDCAREHKSSSIG